MKYQSQKLASLLKERKRLYARREQIRLEQFWSTWPISQAIKSINRRIDNERKRLAKESKDEQQP